MCIKSITGRNLWRKFRTNNKTNTRAFNIDVPISIWTTRILYMHVCENPKCNRASDAQRCFYDPDQTVAFRRLQDTGCVNAHRMKSLGKYVLFMRTFQLFSPLSRSVFAENQAIFFYHHATDISVLVINVYSRTMAIYTCVTTLDGTSKNCFNENRYSKFYSRI